MATHRIDTIHRDTKISRSFVTYYIIYLHYARHRGIIRCSCHPKLLNFKPSNCYNIIIIIIVYGGHAMAYLVEALGYKPEGRGFDSR
jgi:hypothetical protein